MSSSALFPPLVVAGCSGAGKGTLISKLMEWEPNAFGFSVSHTTRDPRPGEVDGTHYHYCDVEKMRKGIAAGDFLESAEVHGNYYGTSRKAVEDVQCAGKICVLDIDVQGVQQVKACKDFEPKPKYLWVEAPDLTVLEKRLRGRGTETEEKVQKRLNGAKKELAFARSKDAPFDKTLVNDVLDQTFDDLKETLQEWYPHLKPDDDTQETKEGPCAVVTNLFRRK